MAEENPAGQTQTAVAAYLKSKQLLLFGFPLQICCDQASETIEREGGGGGGVEGTAIIDCAVFPEGAYRQFANNDMYTTLQSRKAVSAYL